MISVSFFLVATLNGVWPLSVSTWGSAPFASKICATETWPIIAAQISAV